MPTDKGTSPMKLCPGQYKVGPTCNGVLARRVCNSPHHLACIGSIPLSSQQRLRHEQAVHTTVPSYGLPATLSIRTTTFNPRCSNRVITAMLLEGMQQGFHATPLLVATQSYTPIGTGFITVWSDPAGGYNCTQPTFLLWLALRSKPNPA